VCGRVPAPQPPTYNTCQAAAHQHLQAARVLLLERLDAAVGLVDLLHKVVAVLAVVLDLPRVVVELALLALAADGLLGNEKLLADQAALVGLERLDAAAVRDNLLAQLGDALLHAAGQRAEPGQVLLKTATRRRVMTR
jgi:hypothetical protein